MDWRDPFRNFGNASGRELHESPLGIGLAFEDGCDVFWILPGEVTSTVPVPPEGPSSPDELLAACEAIGRVRERALHVVRHYIASKDVELDWRPSGQWGLKWQGGSTSSISVGAHLTAVARDIGDVYEVVGACIKHSWVGKVPSRRRIERYLNTAGEPVGPAGGIRHAEPATSSIRTALGWMGLCNAIDHAEEIDSAEQLQARVRPTGRIGQMFARLAERLPHADAHAELMRRGVLRIRFNDGDDHFEVDSRSRTIARRISKDGPNVVGDQLADQFIVLDAARARTIKAIRQAAAARRWKRQDINLRLFGAERVTHLGLTHIEVSFDPGDGLTAALRKLPPEGALRRLFAETPDFADACIAALNHPVPDEQIQLPDGELAPRHVPPAPPLRTLNDALEAELDAFAAETLRDYLTQPRTIWDYRNADVYDPAIDTWATPDDWVAVANRNVDGEWPHPMAILILLDAKDPRGDVLARAYLARAEPHHEVSDAEVEIVWRYRHALPDVARKWFAPSAGDDVPFAQARANLKDPVAIRFQTIDHLDDDPEFSPAALDMLDDSQREAFHRELISWARTSQRWSPPDPAKLRAALRMQWRDVADALADNPYLLNGLLTRDRRASQFDEPGMLLAKDFLLVWSRLAPSEFLARILATAHGTDMLAAAEQASRQSAIGKPTVEANIGRSLRIYEAWLKDAHLGMAVAWTRWRNWSRKQIPES
jgi:hypothetical protein